MPVDLSSSMRADEGHALEALSHATAKRPMAKYPALGLRLGAMPSYLHRAVIGHAGDALFSFQWNWNNFRDGEVTGRPRAAGGHGPRLSLANVFPLLCGGDTGLHREELRSVRIKLLGSDGQWRFSEPLTLKGCFERVVVEFGPDAS
jgi:hypothetical protein